MSLEVSRNPHAQATLLRQFTWELVWRPERPIYPGMQIELRCPKLRSFHTWRFVRSEIEAGDVEFRCKISPSVSEMRLNPNRVILRARFHYGITPGTPIRILLIAIPGLWAGVDAELSVWTVDIPNNFNPDAEPPVPGREAGSDCRLEVGAGIVEHLGLYSRPMPDAKGRVRTLLVPEDRFGNPSRFTHPVPVRIDWNGTRETVQVSDTLELQLAAPTEAVGRAEARLAVADLAIGETVANGAVQGAERVVVGNPVWRDPVDGRRPVFGEFHWHTDFSGDGQRPLREALRCARDGLNLDYVAPGDHNPKDERWTQTVAALEEMYEPDRFTTFFGWENSSDRGHDNYYFTDPNHPLRCGGEAGIFGGGPNAADTALQALWRQRQDFLVIPHHTNAVAETRKIEDDSPFWHPYPWSEPAPFRTLVEIMQTRGNQERNDYTDAWRGWHQNNGSSVQDALRLGHRLGFTGGTDNHCGWPGRAFAECEGIGRHPPKSVILTGLWTAANRRNEVFEALCQRRSWAVWDTRALVDFHINDTPAGQDMQADSGTELTATIRLSAEDALRTLEIVSEGEVVWSTTTSCRDVELTVPLGPLEHSTHFYLRAMEHKGGIIYASPVFIAVACEPPVMRNP